MQRCWLVPRQWSLPARLAWRNVVSPVTTTSVPTELALCAGNGAKCTKRLELPASLLHTSTRRFNKDGETTSPVAGDSVVSASVQGTDSDSSKPDPLPSLHHVLCGEGKGLHKCCIPCHSS